MPKLLLICRPGGTRTLDPMIKSHVLYQLSYGPETGANLINYRIIVLASIFHAVYMSIFFSLFFFHCIVNNPLRKRYFDAFPVESNF